MSARFEVLRTLGRGGMGHVELVRDVSSGEELARKRLVRFDAARARALKNELRLAGALVHPNLVRLYELGEDERGLFLLMEAVDGVDAVSYCGGRVGPALASMLPQLLSVLRFLHQRGLAHGDLTPPNVMVRPDGRLKLLDFGLSAALGRSGHAGGGTRGYLAPERLEGAPPSAEADLYALGALVAHAVTGRPDGTPTTPPALARAVRALRTPAPRRPSIDALERELLPALGAPPGASTATGPSLRRDWLEARVFGTVIARPGELVVLRGPSGIGKTTLARAVAARVSEAGLGVAWARARPEERVAFNMIDPLVDDVADRLCSGHVSPAVRAAAARAATSFPSLSGLGAVDGRADRVRRAVRAELFGVEPAPPSRGQLFEDLDLLLESADPHAPGRLLVLDDLQWADADSMAFVATLLERGPRRCALLGTARGEWSGLRAPGVTIIDVPPLSDDEVAMFLERSAAFEPATAERVARACGGLPALVDLALRSPGSVDPLGDAVRSVVRDGEREEKRALALLLVAGRPLHEHECAPRAIDLLARRGLVARADGRVDILHDALREPLRAALGADWLRAAHAWRAQALMGDAPDAELVRQLRGAGRTEEAATLARVAAERAERLQAHDLAAELYEVALHGVALDGEGALKRRRAEALERAQRFDEAAAAWAALGREADGVARVDAIMAEAHALLAARRIADGRARLDAALRASGEPALGRGRARRLVTIARFIVGPSSRVGRASQPNEALDRAERRLRSAALVGYFDTTLGLDLLLRAREAFDARGAVEEAAWCELLLAFFARFGHPRGAALSRRYRRAAERRLRGRPVESAVVRSFPAFLDAYDALREGDYRGAIARFDTVLDTIADTREARSFEGQLTTSLRTSAVLATQNVDDAEAAVARFEVLARDGVAIAVQCHVENARALVWTWRGRFEEAVRSMDRLRASWPAEPITVQAILIETYAALPSVLLGDAAGARRRLGDVLRRGRRFAIFGTAYGPIVAVIAGMAELAAHRAGAEADLRAARRWATLGASRRSVLTGLGHRTLAALDVLDGRGADAIDRLAHAEAEALRLGQPIDAALARFARGRRQGRPALEVDARATLAGVGASERLLIEHARLHGAAPPRLLGPLRDATSRLRHE